MVLDGGPEAGPGSLVGRDAQLAVLSRWFDRAAAGHAARVLVGGDAGVGKTALVDAFVAGLPDAVVVRVEADGDRRPGAFQELVAAELGADRARDPTSLLERLGARQEDGPVVVVLHDLHDVDEESAIGLARAVRRLHADRVLVVATARGDGLGRVWTSLFADGPDAATLRLGGLDPDGVRELVFRLRPGRWSRAVTSRLHAETEGNPLHLTTLLRELPDDVLRGDSPLPAPRALADEIASRTARLSDDAHRVLACLVVLARPAGRSLLARLTELADVDVDAAARELTAAGLVDVLALGARSTMRVRHPLVRASVYDRLDPLWRREIHLDLAAAVGGTAELAHRVAAAEGRPDPGLADDLEAAARSEPTDVRAAATRLLDAADLSPTAELAERRLLAACVLLVDAYDTDRLLARAPAVRAARPCPERDVALGFLLSRDADPAAHAHLESALEAADGDPEVRALAGVRLALEHIFRGRGVAAAAAAARVPELTRRPVRGEQALVLQALGRALSEGPDAGLDVLAGHVDHALGADPAITEGTLHLAAGRIAAARSRLEEGIARSRRGAPSSSTHRAHCHLVEVLYRTGRWDLSEAQADIALTWFVDGDRGWAESTAHAVAALVPAARGQCDRAAEHCAAARASLERTFNPQGAHALALAEATLCRALGDADGMARALRRVPATAAAGGMSSAPFAPWRPLHAEALVGSGDLAGARAALRSWPRTGAPLWFRLARHQVQARLALATGDTAAAEITLRAAVATAERHPDEVADECPVELAEIRVLLGGLPHVPDGPEQLRAAAAVFTEIAATPWLDRIRAASTPAEADHGDAGAPPLTPRERQVADLVARGLTSREAAEVLWVTPKAVDFHLGNVFAKLGISSRRQLRGRTFA
ncbi:LuxR C-terminal-related transcriptional regulator [Pseudonocardia benzenivorans]|uniref:LuxR C-terminal-related transcriptional regulator n=1 Tax=Pseudonocardia benzenivorans TaxID=228005 RepID=A0ABW3VD83_9PSEU